MPEPLATTKRKFHKLLDTLTKHANATAAPLPDEVQSELTARDRLLLASDRVSKRRRVGENAISPSRSPSSHSKTSTRSSLRARPQHHAPLSTPAARGQVLPPFSPWSQETFLQRLKTFSSVALWHPKPAAINEVVWAKRGWRCVGVNTVACIGGCERRVIVDLRRKRASDKSQQVGGDGANFPDKDETLAGQAAAEEIDEEDDDDSLQQALTERYAVEVVNGHNDQCLWRRAGCKDDIYRLQVVRPAIWKPQLHQRYKTLLSIANSIRSIRTARAAGAMIDDELTDLLLDMDNGDSTSPAVVDVEDAELRRHATRIARHGWHSLSDSHADLLLCDSCFQRVGLWMYQPGYRGRAASLHADEGDNMAETDAVELDLLTMHREYCPWRNGRNQCATGSLAGLNASEILARVVSTYLREHRRTVVDGISTDPEATSESTADTPDVPLPSLSIEDVDKLDMEREGRLQKLKRLLMLKRSPKVV